MSLRAISNRATRGINPNLPALHHRSDGWDTTPSGKREPLYAQPEAFTVQVQALSKKEIEHLDALNLSNSTTAIYADRQLTGIDRLTGSGGDLVEFDDDAKIPEALRGTLWLVTAVLEGWVSGGWCKAAATRQKVP
jgi:hypothetical protein